MKHMKTHKIAQRGAAHIAGLMAVFVGFALVGIYLLLPSHANPVQNNSGGSKTTGNGSPNGAHYNLNVIGVPKGKTATITSGHRIFVPLDDFCQINLTPGDFDVLDGNCSDKSPADFQLPNPDPNGDGVTSYSVWARTVSKPGGKALVTTCQVEKATGDQLCSLESSIFVRNTGKSTFTNVSLGFLTVLADVDGNAATPPERISIFDDRLQGYLWNYDDQGLRVLQIRFYQANEDIVKQQS